MGVMKCLVIFALLSIGSQTAAQDITATLFEAASENMIVLWTRFSGASSYKVSIAPRNTPNIPTAYAIFGPNVVMGAVHSLSANVMYSVKVEALDGNSLPIATSNTLESSTAPQVMNPIDVVKAKDSTTLMAEFTTVTGATGYIIRIENNANFFREDEVASSPALLGSLEPYTAYTLSIMSKNADGRSQPSTSVEGKTVLPPPVLTTSSPSNDSIIASCSNVTHAVSYSIAAHKFGINNTVIVNTTSPSQTIDGLDAGSLYIVFAYAWDAEGRKGEAAVTNQTTRPPTPADIGATVVWSDDVAGLNVSWSMGQPVHGAVSYHVTVANSTLQCNSTSSPCTLTPVVCGETYVIQVTAANNAGPSYPSDPLVFMSFPCPPENLEVEETEAGNCTLSWNSTLYADMYKAFIKRDDGVEVNCTTTSTSCDFTCLCGYTYLMDVFAYNEAGSSPEGMTLNYTTLPCCPEDVSVSLVSTETLEITWLPVRGAMLYETRAMDTAETIVCNDTSPMCVLSDLTCDSTYNVKVIPCNEIRGCNRTCRPHTKDTAPCMPEDLRVDSLSGAENSFSVSWTANNSAANYTVEAVGQGSPITCTSASDSCSISNLPCGTEYQVTAIASNSAGQSLPSYTVDLETAPCCPENLTVEQVTMAMTNVTWSHARGAHTFITSLTSSRGHARCHTQDSHCLMGCITCGTNYTVGMEAFSRTGHKSMCSYQGFSSSACCPSGIKLYRLANNALRVYWRSSGGNYNYTVEMSGTANYTCTPPAGQTSCDISNVQCGDVYHVTVAPVMPAGDNVDFCPQRMYSVTCTGSNVGMVIYRGKRSVN